VDGEALVCGVFAEGRGFELDCGTASLVAGKRAKTTVTAASAKRILKKGKRANILAGAEGRRNGNSRLATGAIEGTSRNKSEGGRFLQEPPHRLGAGLLVFVCLEGRLDFGLDGF